MTLVTKDMYSEHYHGTTITPNENSTISASTSYMIHFNSDQGYIKFIETYSSEIRTAYPHLKMVAVNTKIYPRNAQVIRSPNEVIAPLNSITANQIPSIQQTILNVSGDLANTGAQSIRIGIIDEGVDASNPALSGLNIIQRDFNGIYQAGTRSHGTGVAAMVGGTYLGEKIGYATGATIVSAAMGNPTPGAIGGDFVGAFEYLLTQNVSIINTSFGGPGYFWADLVSEVVKAGVILVGSAGNTGLSEVSDRYQVTGPGSLPEAISVGAIESDFKPSSYTPMGPGFEMETKPEIVSLGTVYTASLTGMEYRSGTSFSSPHVVGGIAVILQKLGINQPMPGLPEEIKLAIMNTTQTLGEARTGYGIPDLYRAYHFLMMNTTSAMIVQEGIGLNAFHHRNSTSDIAIHYLSNRDLSNVTVVGNLTQLYTGNYFVNATHGYVDLQLQSNISLQYGNYSGMAILSFDNISLTYGMNISVNADFKGEIFLDYTYSTMAANSFSRIYGQSTYMEFAKLSSLGFYLKENFEYVNYSMVAAKILWFQDFFPYDLNYGGGGSSTPVTIDQEFITQLRQYLRHGSVMFGLQGAPHVTGGYPYYATDSQSTKMLQDWLGINYRNYDASSLSSNTMISYGSSNTSLFQPQNIVGSASMFEVVSNHPSTFSLYATDIYGPILISLGEGKIIVAQNELLKGCFPQYKNGDENMILYNGRCEQQVGLQNTGFLQNLTTWMMSPDMLSYRNYTINGGIVGIDVFTTYNETLQTTIFVNSKAETQSDLHHLSFNVNKDSIVLLDTEQGVRHISKTLYADFLPPVLSTDIQNNSVVYQRTALHLNVSERFLNTQSMEISIDGVIHEFTGAFIHNNESSYMYTVYLPTLSQSTHTITYSISDQFGHTSILTLYVIVENDPAGTNQGSTSNQEAENSTFTLTNSDENSYVFQGKQSLGIADYKYLVMVAVVGIIELTLRKFKYHNPRD